MKTPEASRKYTAEEKQQLLANLDVEVEHKVRQFEAWLADALANFRIHQEGLISRIPRLVRGVTMAEFGDKYDGNIQACLRSLQPNKLGPDILETDKTARKRKWIAAQEEVEASGANSSAQDANPRVSKNARMMTATPKKKPGSSTGPGTAQHARLASTNKTPKMTFTNGRLQPIPASLSPSKFGKPSNNGVVPSSRSNSPSKPHVSRHVSRPPSSATFNPVIPKTMAYPGFARIPRRDESMLSMNGSPLANPYQLGLGWFAGVTGNDAGDARHDKATNVNGKDAMKAADGAARTLRRTNSITIRQDPSVAASSTGSSSQGSNGLHSRTNSQTNLIPPSQTHSRMNSYTETQTDSRSFVDAKSNISTPQRSLSSQAHTTALVAIPTKDGHLLEFDPLQTSPGAVDALEGITDSAKKQTKEEMVRLVQAAVLKWTIS